FPAPGSERTPLPAGTPEDGNRPRAGPENLQGIGSPAESDPAAPIPQPFRPEQPGTGNPAADRRRMQHQIHRPSTAYQRAHRGGARQHDPEEIGGQKPGRSRGDRPAKAVDPIAASTGSAFRE